MFEDVHARFDELFERHYPPTTRESAGLLPNAATTATPAGPTRRTRPTTRQRTTTLLIWGGAGDVVKDVRMNDGRLPPLAAEDHVCDVCAMAYAETGIDDAVGVIAGIPGAVREAVYAVPAELRRVRPGPGVWSINEYVCHLRDVYVTFTIRLHRVRKEHRPAWEPMFNDLRARRFGYNDCNLGATLDEMAAATAGFRDEIGRTAEPEWDRVGTRLPGEERTARWLVRQAVHEGVHHLGDIRRFGSELVVP
jgi:DinB superfamily